MRVVTAAAGVVCFACAHVATHEEVDGLRTEVATLKADNVALQRKVEKLEARLTLITAARGPEKRGLPVVKILPAPASASASGRAPPLKTDVAMQEPDEAAVRALDDDGVPPPDAQEIASKEANDAEAADADFAAAVGRYNDGDHRAAADEFMAFFEKWPRHPAADNALYMAGLGLSTGGDCAAAIPWFKRVPKEFPAGDAVPAALLEEGRCRARLKESEAARAAFEKVRKEFPGTTEAEQARVALERMK